MNNNISLNKKDGLNLLLDENTIVIDVMNDEVFDEFPPITDDIYKIPFTPNFFQDILKFIEDEDLKLLPNTNILVYCYDGKNSLNACEILRENGYLNSFNLQGGILNIFNEITKESGVLLD